MRNIFGRRRFLKSAAIGVAGASLTTTSCTTRDAEAQNATGANADLGGRLLLPAGDAWNRDISADEVDPASDAILQSIGLDKPLHEDFGLIWKGQPAGIPYCAVDGDQPRVPVTFEYADESDPGPYPVPPDAPVEGGPDADGDRHVLVLDRENHTLYELFNAFPVDGGKSWKASSGAIFDLKNPKPRPAGWTSADAAGLPILPGLARYDEIVGRGELRHALRFTVRKSRRAYVPPASHWASPHRDANLPPMGMRVRLKAGFDTSKFTGPARVILEGLKKYGLILADNGGDWFVSGAPDPRWVHDELLPIRQVRGRDLEVVRMTGLVAG
jgi:hypothetical protein